MLWQGVLLRRRFPLSFLLLQSRPVGDGLMQATTNTDDDERPPLGSASRRLSAAANRSRAGVLGPSTALRIRRHLARRPQDSSSNRFLDARGPGREWLAMPPSHRAEAPSIAPARRLLKPGDATSRRGVWRYRAASFTGDNGISLGLHSMGESVTFMYATLGPFRALEEAGRLPTGLGGIPRSPARRAFARLRRRHRVYGWHLPFSLPFLAGVWW